MKTLYRTISAALVATACACGSPVVQPIETNEDSPESPAPRVPPEQPEPSPSPEPGALSPPHGIYVLDSAAGDGLANIRDKSFISGYVWRRGTWASFEPEAGAYDFAALDAVIAALEPLGQKLTLTVSATVVPGWLSSDPAVETWQTPGTSGATELTAVPWDPTALARYELFVVALADHLVPDASRGGALVPLKEHPVLAQIHAPVMGLGGLRFKTPSPTTLPGYSRDRFLDAVVRSAHAVVDQFPEKAAYLAFFPIDDGIMEPPLTDAALALLTSEFNAEGPRLNFYQENLTATTPDPTAFGAHLATASQSTNILFQACWSWSTATPSWCTIGSEETPADGLLFGNANYGSRYFEVYVADVDSTAFEQGFADWAAQL